MFQNVEESSIESMKKDSYRSKHLIETQIDDQLADSGRGNDRINSNLYLNWQWRRELWVRCSRASV